jgi:hypothetical protein
MRLSGAFVRSGRAEMKGGLYHSAFAMTIAREHDLARKP